MPDNPTRGHVHPVALSDHAVLAITGADALKFAQAQFMNDVATLGDGDWQWNGWLNAKGRLRALFALVRMDAHTLWLLLADQQAAAMAAALQPYVFRSKVALTPRDDLQVTGYAEAALPSRAHEHSADAADGASLAWPGGRRIVIHPPDAVADPDRLPDPHEADRQAWRQADLRAGIPRMDAERFAQWTPQQLSLERLPAFSVKKGCYPGQEIVARTHFLGQAKRGLRLFETTGELAAGSEVAEGDRSVGEIVCSAGPIALAVVSLDARPDRAGGQPAQPLDFET